MLSKKPIVNAILSFVLGAAGLALFNLVMSLINGTSFKKEIGGTGDIIIRQRKPQNEAHGKTFQGLPKRYFKQSAADSVQWRLGAL